MFSPKTCYKDWGEEDWYSRQKRGGKDYLRWNGKNWSTPQYQRKRLSFLYWYETGGQKTRLLNLILEWKQHSWYFWDFYPSTSSGSLQTDTVWILLRFHTQGFERSNASNFVFHAPNNRNQVDTEQRGSTQKLVNQLTCAWDHVYV